MSWRHHPSVLSLSTPVICVPRPSTCVSRAACAFANCIYTSVCARAHRQPGICVWAYLDAYACAYHAPGWLRRGYRMANGEIQPATETVIYSRFSGPAAPLAAHNRSWSPSLFRVYLMWITPARATVAWGSSPPAGQGQFETLSATSDEGSNLGGDTVFRSYRFALRIALVPRSSFASPRSCISHRDSNKGKFVRFVIDDDIRWRIKSLRCFLSSFYDIPRETGDSLKALKRYL